VRLILVRHAHADPGDPDELRPLSARGRDQAQALAEQLAAEVGLVLVVTSPLLRARETAAPIARAASAELRVDERLSPGAGPDDVLAAAADADGPVVTVGHQPDCSLIAEALGVEIDFPPAGHVIIEL
jgi:phosphohistidine phosphatase